MCQNGRIVAPGVFRGAVCLTHITGQKVDGSRYKQPGACCLKCSQLQGFLLLFLPTWSLGLQVLHHKITSACFRSSSVADSSIHCRSLLSISLYVALCWAQGKWMSQTRWSPSITQGQVWEMDGEASHKRLHKVMRYEDGGEKQRAWVAQRRLEDKGRPPRRGESWKGSWRKNKCLLTFQTWEIILCF